VPVVGAGSAYDGSAYVEYLTGRAAASSSNVPVVGAGSAYDGGAYGTVPAAPAQPSCLGIIPPTGIDMSVISTGLNDYVRRCSAQQSVKAQPIGLGIDPPAGVERSELPAGLTDYIRPSQ
jgi:hypothetical protein